MFVMITYDLRHYLTMTHARLRRTEPGKKSPRLTYEITREWINRFWLNLVLQNFTRNCQTFYIFTGRSLTINMKQFSFLERTVLVVMCLICNSYIRKLKILRLSVACLVGNYYFRSVCKKKIHEFDMWKEWIYFDEHIYTHGHRLFSLPLCRWRYYVPPKRR
jgi:hypothetical protein